MTESAQTICQISQYGTFPNLGVVAKIHVFQSRQTLKQIDSIKTFQANPLSHFGKNEIKAGRLFSLITSAGDVMTFLGKCW